MKSCGNGLNATATAFPGSRIELSMVSIIQITVLPSFWQFGVESNQMKGLTAKLEIPGRNLRSSFVLSSPVGDTLLLGVKP
jgi:hypothetical protein